MSWGWFLSTTSKYNIIHLSLCCQSNLNASYSEHMAVLPLCLPVKHSTLQTRKKENSCIRGNNVLIEMPVCKCLFCNKPCETCPCHTTRSNSAKEVIAAYFILTLDSLFTKKEWKKLLTNYVSFWKKKPSELTRFGFDPSPQVYRALMLNKLYVWDEILNSHWTETECFSVTLERPQFQFLVWI